MTARLVLTLCALLCVAPAGCGTVTADKAGGPLAVEPITLTMPSVVDRNELGPFVDAVTRLSGGSLNIQVQDQWHASDPAKETDLIRHVAAGGAPLAAVPARAWNDVGVRSLDALNAPFVIEDIDLEQRVLETDLVDDMLSGVAPLGLDGLGILPGPLRHPVGLTRDLVAPEDYAGARIGISASEMADRTFTALHASTEPQLFGSVPIGRVDGIEVQNGLVNSEEYPARSITANVALWPRATVLVGNNAAMKQLSESHQQVLRQAAQEAVPVVARYHADNEAESAAVLCRRGGIRIITATPTQLDQLRGAVDPVYAYLREDRVTNAVLDRVTELRRSATPTATKHGNPC